MAAKHRIIPTLTRKDIARFWAKVDKSAGHGPNGDCWQWTAAFTTDGYGQFSMRHMLYLAHRVAYTLDNGPLPPGMCVCHFVCDNPRCVNAAHLGLGSRAVNNADMTAKGRSVHETRAGLRGESSTSHKLTEELVREIRRAYRNGGTTLGALADQHGVSKGCIYKVIHRRTWVDVQ